MTGLVSVNMHTVSTLRQDFFISVCVCRGRGGGGGRGDKERKKWGREWG